MKKDIQRHLLATVFCSSGVLYGIFAVLFCLLSTATATAGARYNFNSDWYLSLGEGQEQPGGLLPAMQTNIPEWGQRVTLPYAWNQGEAYSRNCSELSDTVMWYRKAFRVPKEWKGRHIFVEFEGARFAAQAFINGKELGWSENGVMAFGFDLTPYIIYGKDNFLAVRVDNDWRYKERGSGAEYQWNNKNFYCNYGGLNKNVWLHVMGDVHQTLPLYSNLGTTGVYVYATEHDVKGRSATVNCESQVVNASRKARNVELRVQILDAEGKEIASFPGEKRTIAAGDTVTLRASQRVGGLHFWSWGYGYLYTVKSYLVNADAKVGKDAVLAALTSAALLDVAETQTGFRKTEFRDGMFALNDRVLQLKGFAQRSTNEWPALGISIPAWMSDYSNGLVLGCNGNFFRWMHVTPSKQDVRSFDRLGLIQAMPAGDAEKDVSDRRWQQRLELMRDAIIYNRNNPSVIFYEGGNNQITEGHMDDLKAIRDKYDPNGGRAIGCRNMLDSKVAEYGGEMLYVNKSAGKPMFQMEYNRDEGIRRYWDEWSYPYHKEGEGPMYRGEKAVVAYNHNQDGLAVENIVRWNEYWMARPGTGKRVNAGGAKIIFADSNTHARGEKNYRTSGDMDAMRIPKDSWFVHQAMWDGWVDTERHHTYIIGHWNYETGVKPVYVCSTGDEVELFLNGKSLGKGERSETFLFTFRDVQWEPGTLRAVSYDKAGNVLSDHETSTVGEPVALRMRWIEPDGAFRADGADVRIAEVEAVDRDGRRHPLAHDLLRFSVEGPAEYIGGLSGLVSDEERAANEAAARGEAAAVREGHSSDSNGVGSRELALEAGVIRVMIRSTMDPGEIKLHAECIGNAECEKGSSTKPLQNAVLVTRSVPCAVKDGFYVDAQGKPIEADWAKQQPLCLDRGETPLSPSYTQRLNTVAVKTIDVAVNQQKARNMTDDNEASEWASDTNLGNSWVKVTLEREAEIAQIALRLRSFRSTSYPLQVFAGDRLVWEGYTPKTLGDCYLDIATPVRSAEYTIRMIGPATVKEAFGSMVELAAKQNLSTAESKSNTLSIIEMAFNEAVR